MYHKYFLLKMYLFKFKTTVFFARLLPNFAPNNIQVSNIPCSNVIFSIIIRLLVTEVLRNIYTVNVKGPFGYFCSIIFT